MAQLSSEERIKRVELAPEDVRVMVAKAYLRDDIDDEDVQYLFNADTIEEMNEMGLEGVENIDAEEPEGIGASAFTMRTSKPGAGNKNYITTGAGGWSTCIKGKPTDANCNVLANCVGFSSARFNEIINEMRGTEGCTYKTLNCNAENFIERAVAAGLETGSTPKVGAIMCWMKGSTLNSGDGAGHVAIVERIDSDSQVYTSESGYNSTAFWNQTRSNSNGRWGMNSNYSFRGFIYLPTDVQELVDGKEEEEVIEPEPTPTVVEPEQTEETVVEPVVEDSLKVGDKVKIVGTGNGSSMGTSNTAYGIGWTRQILKIYEGRAYPYRVGNNSGTTGYYKAEALQKK